jgi:hypothetical protein
MNPVIAIDVRTYARTYAALGWPVFPLKPGSKSPATPRGFHDATTDPDEIDRLFPPGRDLNVGIATTEFWVLDVDGPEGAASLDALEIAHGPLPETLQAVTRNGGRHLCFLHPKNQRIRCRTGIRPGLDVRGDGGYIAAEPSTVPADNPAGPGRYAWIDWEPDTGEVPQIAHAPGWLLALLVSEPAERPARPDPSDGKIIEGRRNDYLSRQAFKLRKGGASPDEIFAILRRINEEKCQPPLPDAELRAIARGKASVAPDAPPADVDPVPLPGELSPVEPFDYALLPNALRPWVADIAERVSCPPDFVAVPAMLALASVIGRKVAVRPQQHSDWTVIPNLWGVIIGRPGAMKSPAMMQATAPLKRLAARAQEEYDAAMREWTQAQRMRELQGDAAEKKARALLAKDPSADVRHLLGTGEEDAAPTLRRYSTSNATMEAMGELLRQNPQGLLLERDEIMGLLRDLDREDKADHRAFLLESWDGNGSFTFDRIGRGFNLRIPHMCLSVIGTTQPGRIRDYLQDALNGTAADDGLIQRFSMAVWPDQTSEWINVDQWPDTAAKREAWAVFDRLDKLAPHEIGAAQDVDLDGLPDGPPYLRLGDAALGLFVEWRTELERRLRSGELHPAIESHLSKYRKLVPALALICHLADDGRGPVSEPAMLRALGWATYLESHAMRIYGGAVSREIDAARAILRRIKRGDLPRDGFGSRDVWRPNWSGLADREIVQGALNYLVDMGWLVETRQPTAGRPLTIYRLNGRAKL